MGDRELSRELNAGSILDIGQEVIGGAIAVDIGEEVRWFDGVVPGTALSEVVRSGY